MHPPVVAVLMMVMLFGGLTAFLHRNECHTALRTFTWHLVRPGPSHFIGH
jgi:hypothetical protein